MAGLDWTRLLVILLTLLIGVILIALVTWLLFHVVTDLFLVGVAAILSALLRPVVDAAQTRLRLYRPVAIALIYGALIACLGAFVVLYGPPLVAQMRTLGLRLPVMLHQLNEQVAAIGHTLHGYGLTVSTGQLARDVTGALGTNGSALLQGALGVAQSAGTVAFDAVLVLVIAAYLLNERDPLGRLVTSVTPRAHATRAVGVLRGAAAILGRYVRAQLLVAAMVGLLICAGALALGVPYAPVIGLFAFIIESVPILGPIIATVPAVLIALTASTGQAAGMLVWCVVVQQVEQNVILPRLSGHAVGLHPVVALMSILLGYQVGGLWGALFGVPLVGFVVAIIREAVGAQALEEGEAERAPHAGTTAAHPS